jgi:hypothetical protein
VDLAVLVTEIACTGMFLAFAIGFIYSSCGKGRMLPALWVMVGILTVSWLEAPFGNARTGGIRPVMVCPIVPNYPV